MPDDYCYCDKEWSLVEGAYDALKGGDTPPEFIDECFECILEERERDPYCPPSLTLQNVFNQLDHYCELARTERSYKMFEGIRDVALKVLQFYLQDILFVKEEEWEDYAVRQVAIPEYYTAEQYRILQRRFA